MIFSVGKAFPSRLLRAALPIPTGTPRNALSNPLHPATTSNPAIRRRVRDKSPTLPPDGQLAPHHHLESPRTTKLYDRTNDTLTLEEIERIRV